MHESEWKTIIKNEANIKRLFFGRESVDADSIFERIFSPINDVDIVYTILPNLLNYVWITFQLKDHPEILTLVSLLLIF